MSQRIKQLILLCLMAMSVVATSVSAEGIKLKSFEMERVDNDWYLSASFQIELSPGKYTITKTIAGNGVLGGPFNIEVKSGVFTETQLKFSDLRA